MRGLFQRLSSAASGSPTPWLAGAGSAVAFAYALAKRRSKTDTDERVKLWEAEARQRALPASVATEEEHIAANITMRLRLKDPLRYRAVSGAILGGEDSLLWRSDLAPEPACSSEAAAVERAAIVVKSLDSSPDYDYAREVIDSTIYVLSNQGTTKGNINLVNAVLEADAKRERFAPQDC